MLRRLLLPLLCILGAFAGCSATSTKGDASLYQRAGGEPVISAAVEQTVYASMENELLKEDFQNVFVPRLVETITELICERAGGPCAYSGLTMENAHRGMNVTEAQMNEFVEEFRQALERLNVQDREINELIGVLAPMKRDLVYR